MDSDSDDTTTAPEPYPHTEPSDIHMSDPPTASFAGAHPASSSPIAPSFTSIGSPEVPSHSELRPPPSKGIPKQLTPELGGDERPAVSSIEGMLDKSEDPSRVKAA